MVQAVLKQTTNARMTQYVGKTGRLEIIDNRFHFRFEDVDGECLDLTSYIARQLGDLAHPSSKEVCFETSNSTYVFEKQENVRESLFDWLTRRK